MRIIALKCSECSAPLDVPAEREQLTCDWCGSMLHVSQLEPQTGPAAPADQPEPPVRVAAMSEQERALRRELDQLDAEWAAYRVQFLSFDGSGECVIPEPEACRRGAWATIVLGGGCAAIFGLAGRSLGLAAVCLIATAIVTAILRKQAKIAPVYERSLENYRRERRAILEKMPAAK